MLTLPPRGALRMRTVSSRQNPIVRTFRALADQPDPTGERVLLDGAHLVQEAHASGAAFEVLAIASSRLTEYSDEGMLARTLEAADVDVVVAADRVFAALSPVKTPSGLVAIVRRQVSTPAMICGAAQAFIVAAVDVQDPGNVGSLLRAAEAGGASGAFACGTSANPFSWKALRGSMGSALRLPVVAGMPTDAVLACMKSAGVRIIAAVARGGDDPDEVDWRGRVGLLVGSEGAGLGDDVVAQSDGRVTIPMATGVESLNVAAAGAVLVYAARRQRVTP